MSTYREGVARCRIDSLRIGRRVDLEADPVADPDYYASGDPATSEHVEFQYEFEVVAAIERETADCIRIDFASGFSCGFAPDYEIDVDPEQEESAR